MPFPEMLEGEGLRSRVGGLSAARPTSVSRSWGCAQYSMEKVTVIYR